MGKEFLILRDCARADELQNRPRAKEVVEHGNITAVTPRELLGIGNLADKIRIVVRKRLYLCKFGRRRRLLDRGIAIGEKAVRHDLYKIRLDLVNVANLALEQLLFELRMRERVRMRLIFEEVEPKARRHTFHLFAVHCIQNQLFLR